MNIIMSGIDHNKASIEYRELFALTKSAQTELMLSVSAYEYVNGCVVINTCNRTEIWLSYEGICPLTPFEILCEIKGIQKAPFESLFTTRQGTEALNHLFELACGLRSKVFGEEQIITQVKDSIRFARENKTSDPVLETLFRSAITAAKKVKTQVRITSVNRSVAVSTAELLKEKFGHLSGLRCLVIGNGEMGRLAAKTLVEEGCVVTMTLRQYKNGEAVIPFGCNVIHYDDRNRFIEDADVIISATTSPHYTLHCEDIAKVVNTGKKIFIDMAVPRDIDPMIAELSGAELYDIDDFGASLTDEAANGAVREAKQILCASINDFENWYHFRSLLPKINQISETAAESIENRIKDKIQSLEIKEDEQDSLCETVNKAAFKVVEKIMFGLKEDIDRHLWEECINSIERAVSNK